MKEMGATGKQDLVTITTNQPRPLSFRGDGFAFYFFVVMVLQQFCTCLQNMEVTIMHVLEKTLIYFIKTPQHYDARRI